MLSENYTDKSLIGRSENTEVFCATRVDFGRREAIKVLREPHRNNASLRNRFIQSASTWAGLNHSNITKIYNVVKDESAVITEYFQHSLQGKISAGPADEASLRSFLRDCLNGLDYLHRSGYLHLNFKPSNVFVTQQGTWQLADGHCFRIGSHQQLAPPSGTWKYLSPELLDEDAPLGTGSDLYSLGFLALEYLVGPEFDANFGGTSNTNFDSNMAWHNWHCNRNQENPLASDVCSHISEPLARVIDGMTRKKLDNRLYRAPDVLRILDQLESGGSTSTAVNNSVGVMNQAARKSPTTSSSQATCELTVLSGPLIGQVFSIARSQFEMGGVDASVIDFDPELYPGTESQSIKMACRDNAWEVTSQSMFFVNSQPAARTREIRSGDILRFGTSGPEVQFVRVGSKSISVASVLSSVRNSGNRQGESSPTIPSGNEAQPGPPTVKIGNAGVSPEPPSRPAPPVNGASPPASASAANRVAANAPSPPQAPADTRSASANGAGRPVAPAAPVVPNPPRPATAGSPRPVAPNQQVVSSYQSGYGNRAPEEDPVAKKGLLARLFGKKDDLVVDAQPSQARFSAAPAFPSGGRHAEDTEDAQPTKGLSKNQQNWLAGIGTGLVGVVAFFLVPTGGVEEPVEAMPDESAIVVPEEVEKDADEQPAASDGKDR